MSAIQTVVYDFGALSLLMLIGYFIRKKSKLLQDLYLPAALVAGFVGLLLGPQVLGRFSPICFPIQILCVIGPAYSMQCCSPFLF